jgi:hypothetical protein
VANTQAIPVSTGSREHRRFQRVSCEGPADIRVLPHGGRETGTLANMSTRGCCFLADQPLRGVPGSRIEIHVRVIGIDLRMVGVIRHVDRQRRAGIEFLDLTDRKAGEIDEVLGELTETEGARIQDKSPVTG